MQSSLDGRNSTCNWIEFTERLHRELKHWHTGEHFARAIWEAQLSEVFDLLLAFGFDVKSSAGYRRIDSMRLVVNVFKHGDGASLDELKERYPEFLPDLSGSGEMHRFHLLDHTAMKLTDRDLEAFSEAIVNFWHSVPGEIYFYGANAVEVPKRFEKALKKDEVT